MKNSKQTKRNKANKQKKQCIVQYFLSHSFMFLQINCDPGGARKNDLECPLQSTWHTPQAYDGGKPGDGESKTVFLVPKYPVGEVTMYTGRTTACLQAKGSTWLMQIDSTYWPFSIIYLHNNNCNNNDNNNIDIENITITI